MQRLLFINWSLTENKIYDTIKEKKEIEMSTAIVIGKIIELDREKQEKIADIISLPKEDAESIEPLVITIGVFSGTLLADFLDMTNDNDFSGARERSFGKVSAKNIIREARYMAQEEPEEVDGFKDEVLEIANLLEKEIEQGTEELKVYLWW